jgi:hypothetical protein
MSHVMQVLDGRLQRRVSMTVRRDAAQRLSNGRVLYDALFTRTGYQTYPRADGSISVEYRPPSEVFRADSMATLGGLPGVLLHPSENFGTKFDGAYDVKGCTGERVVEHTDHIHTAGTLCVWDGEWNAAIEQQTIAELSAGYTIRSGPPGHGPDGTHFDAMHCDIIADHMAGVPAGNAGTARVLTDALASMPLATRAALADIAAMRMDARPLYVDLGRWPHREKPRMDEQPQIPEPAPVVEPEKPAPVVPAPAEQPAPDATKQDAERQRVFDAAVADAADRRTDLLELARRAIGPDYSSRTDGKPTSAPKTDAQIKRDIIAKIDAPRLSEVDAYTDAVQQRVALDMQLAECRKKVDAAAAKGPALLAAINQAHADRAAAPELTADEKAMQDRLDAVHTSAGHVRGVPAQAAHH